ncbi:HNH endonuclease [Castellaniella defragrans]|uniref:HNH endonuclease n=1 Tax=Castellaniella defragrans TaxID=75697 RepID=UPI00156A5633|nr:HNH endonuclease signature motif containing protein [Castellaniella defragrans]
MTKANKSGREADPRRTIPLNSVTWRKLRAAVLTEEPLCRHCAARGITEPATDVDHISGDPSDNSRENLCPLCHSCHSIKTARDHGKNVAMGCDVNGCPLDPSHPWYRRSDAVLAGQQAIERQKSRAADGNRPSAPPSFNADC